MNHLSISHVHHIAIICNNYLCSKKFYCEVLGFEIIRETYRQPRDSYKLDLRLPDGTQIELFSFPGAPKRPSYPEAQGLRHLAFAVDDIDESVAYLISQDIAVEAIRIDELTNKRFTFFNDPDGLPLELYEN